MSRRCNCSKNTSKTEANSKVKDICKDLMVTNDQLRQIMKILLDNIKLGLGKKTNATAIVKCYSTYVQNLPTGKEKGKFLALDLGGTNFRVLLIYLNMNQKDVSKVYPIAKEVMVGPGDKLFDCIAESLASFMKENNIQNEVIPLGFTFSFPLSMLGLNKGVLVRWTKGFTCSGVVGKDVVQLLNEAIGRRKDIRITVSAILNDTTGTLMSCAWKYPNCRIGFIIGTGTNSCYVEKQENVELFDAVNSGSGNVVINTECGAFGDDGSIDFIRTEMDEIVDAGTVNPKKQIFEKMASGMYLGELVRVILVKCIKETGLFKGNDSDIIRNRESFTTTYISEIESDAPGTYTNIRRILHDLGLDHGTSDDCRNLRYICECVSRRSAFIVSAGIATLLNKMGERDVTVGIDGSVYRFHPKYNDLMNQKIGELADPKIQFKLVLSEDGSGRGAALVAAALQ